MTPDSPIDRDVACTKCGYNVRTLAVMARCTECGFPVLRSFVGHEAGVGGGGVVDPERVTRTALLILARLLRRNRDALAFVLEANQRASSQARSGMNRLLQRPADVTANDLCRSLADFALDHFGNHDDALATLRFWRIERSEDVGEIVAGLAEAGLISPGENDSPADFIGVCGFDELLAHR